MNMEPMVALFVLFACGVGATAIFFILFFVGAKILFAAKAPAAATAVGASQGAPPA